MRKCMSKKMDCDKPKKSPIDRGIEKAEMISKKKKVRKFAEGGAAKERLGMNKSPKKSTKK